MRTVRSNIRLPGEVSAQGGGMSGVVSAREVFAKGGVYTPPAVDRILDTRLWKHYLSATSFVDGK